MADELFLYLIVLLNTTVQLFLIRSLGLPAREKRKYLAIAIAIPLCVMASMRLLVLGGIVGGNVADQGFLERCVTDAAGILIMAGPWLATLAAVITRYRPRLLHHPHRPGEPGR
jgi:hypothetical protein